MGASYTAVSRLGTEITKLNETRIETNIQESLVRELPWRTIAVHGPATPDRKSTRLNSSH